MILNFLTPEPLDPETLVTSVHVSSVTLFRIRCAFVLYLIAVLIGEWVYDVQHMWGFFTEWSWIGLIIYFSTAVYNGHVYNSSKDAVASMRSRPYLVQYLNWLSYVLPAVYVYIITLVFWTVLNDLLSDVSPLNKWLLSSQHAFNSIVMISELILGRVPLSYAFLVPFVFISLSYLALVYVFYRTTGIWAYSFLNTSKSFAWAWYLGIIVFFLLVFVGIVAIHQYRDRRRETKGMKVVGGSRLDSSHSALNAIV
ncbi:hypothetical protein BDR26DRAFT_856925 [Obelidium mucronatum]|nr:hypothetical protein BDR26DRAFT_856925 [Obelidium mucronatum]